MQCSNCQYENPAEAKFCNACGAKLEARCPQCSHVNPSGSRFCNACGSSLTTHLHSSVSYSTFQVSSPQPPAPGVQTLAPRPQTRDARRSEGERRQLTVMFCDLVGSTVLSQRLDPEDLHQLVRAYQQACAAVITRYEGHIAQYLRDGILVYFGYPAAHEDDAIRAVRTSLEILDQLQHKEFAHPLQVRIGIHTGPVVVGEIGSSEKREILALGETPNITARVQGQAEPNTLVISGDTYHLVQGFFACQDLGPHEVKGLSTP